MERGFLRVVIVPEGEHAKGPVVEVCFVEHLHSKRSVRGTCSFDNRKIERVSSLALNVLIDECHCLACHVVWL